MDLPTVEELAGQLAAVSGAENVDVDAPLLQLADVDSLDLMEWLYGFQNKYPDVPADESLFKDIDDTTTLRAVHEKLMALAPAAARG
jgi:acyl carrier protein